MQKLWSYLRYDLTGDYKYIPPVTFEDFKLLWILNAGFVFNSDNDQDLLKELDNDIISYDYNENKLLKYLFNDVLKLDTINYGFLKKNIDFVINKLAVYLQNDDKILEWNALVEVKSGNIFMILGNDWYLPIVKAD